MDELTSRARKLRQDTTDAERLLCAHLRGRRMAGRKFRRQVVVGPYIVDFMCLEERLIVEADGGQHGERESYDAGRTANLEAKSYRVLRFWNHEILTELDSVLEAIRTAIESS